MTGCGRVVFNSVSTFANGLVVYSPATVAVNPGKRPGNGTVTVHDGATLEVAQSGTANLNGGLTLASGAPNWVKGVSVADGEIVLEVKSRGFMLIVK